MKTIKKLIKKLIIWALVENDAIEFNHLIITNKSFLCDGSVNAGGSISACGDIASFVENKQEDKK